MPLFRHTFFALGGPNEIQLYAESSAQADILFALAASETSRIEEKYSRFRESSIISRINQSAGLAEYITVDDETALLLDYAQTCFEQSDGLFDITSGVLSRAWGFRDAKIPEQSEIDRRRELVGWKKVEWKKPQARLSLAGMEIDLGGFGKEYAVDRAAGLLLGHGVKSGLINFAGDLRILGPHPEGSPWSVGVTHPRVSNDVLAAVGASTGAVATSGDYERFFEKDGRRYCHIINPFTGYPVDGLQAVTVLAPSCLVAGTAATIAMLSGNEKGRTYLSELGLPFIAVSAQGEIVTRGFVR